MESKSRQSILKTHKKCPSNSGFQTKKIDKKLIEQRSSKNCNKFRNALYHETEFHTGVLFPRVHFNSRIKSIRLSSQSSKYYTCTQDFQFGNSNQLNIASLVQDQFLVGLTQATACFRLVQTNPLVYVLDISRKHKINMILLIQLWVVPKIQAKNSSPFHELKLTLDVQRPSGHNYHSFA